MLMHLEGVLRMTLQIYKETNFISLKVRHFFLKKCRLDCRLFTTKSGCHIRHLVQPQLYETTHNIKKKSTHSHKCPVKLGLGDKLDRSPV